MTSGHNCIQGIGGPGLTLIVRKPRKRQSPLSRTSNLHRVFATPRICSLGNYLFYKGDLGCDFFTRKHWRRALSWPYLASIQRSTEDNRKTNKDYGLVIVFPIIPDIGRCSLSDSNMVQNKPGILYRKAMKGSSHTTSLHLRSLDTVSGEGDVDELLLVTFCFWTQELIQSLKRWVLQSNAIMLKNPSDSVGNQSHEALQALQDRELSKDPLFFDSIPFPQELLYH